MYMMFSFALNSLIDLANSSKLSLKKIKQKISDFFNFGLRKNGLHANTFNQLYNNRNRKGKVHDDNIMRYLMVRKFGEPKVLREENRKIYVQIIMS